MELLYALERIRIPFLDEVMGLITHLGGEMFFMVIAVAVFWCVSKRMGYYLMTVGFFGTVINQFLKIVCCVPRPWVKDPNFTIVESARAEATGYSFPSGHTQNAVATYGGIARYTRRGWVRWLCVALVLVICFSRMYLGVHTLLDVGVAAVLAVALVVLLYPVMEHSDIQPRVMAAIIGAMLALAVGYLLFVLLWHFHADVDAENLASGVENGWKLLGATVGLLAAWWLDRTAIHFDTRAPWYVQIVKLVGGLLLVVAIKTGLKAPLVALLGAGVGGAVRYGVLVLFAGAIWPMTFDPLCHLMRKRIY